jgi:hypothetical protein
VVLDTALAMIIARLPGATLAGLSAVKFTAIVQPGQEVEVDYREPENATVSFTCTCRGAIAVRGTALIRSQR